MGGSNTQIPTHLQGKSQLTLSVSSQVKRGERKCVYSKKRTPSWCDRVLYKARDTSTDGTYGTQKRHELVSFDSVPEVISSDHKPVRGLWLLYPAPVRPLSEHVIWHLVNVVASVFDARESMEDDTAPGPPQLRTESSEEDVPSPMRSYRFFKSDIASSGSSSFAVTPVQRRSSNVVQPKLLIKALSSPRDCLNTLPQSEVRRIRPLVTHRAGRSLGYGIGMEVLHDFGHAPRRRRRQSGTHTVSLFQSAAGNLASCGCRRSQKESQGRQDARSR